VEGLPLCRNFVRGDPARFDRLLAEQLTPDLLADQIRIDGVGTHHEGAAAPGSGPG
jgi:hypothetical protein